MSILSKLEAYFKKVFGSTKPPKEGFRRLKKAELKKLGLSEKSERYVRADLKKPNSRSKTFSKRAVQQARAGETLEARAERRRPKSRVLPTGDMRRTSYKITYDERSFDKLTAKLRQQYPPNSRMGVFIGFQNGTRSSRTIYLSEYSWHDVEKAATQNESFYKSDNLGDPINLTVNIDQRI